MHRCGCRSDTLLEPSRNLAGTLLNPVMRVAVLTCIDTCRPLQGSSNKSALWPLQYRTPLQTTHGADILQTHEIYPNHRRPKSPPRPRPRDPGSPLERHGNPPVVLPCCQVVDLPVTSSPFQHPLLNRKRHHEMERGLPGPREQPSQAC